MKNLSFDEGLKKLLDISIKLKNTHFLDTQNALNYVICEDIYCTKNLPSFDNSAMDGYAFKYDEINNPLNVKSTILAGTTNSPSLSKNECYKIMTGAKIPNGVDTVAEYEKAIITDEGKIKINTSIKKHNAIRYKGEESKENSLLIKKQTLLKASHIMLLATQGITKVNVYKKPKIAIISNGDELKEPWENASEESIYNCNSAGIMSLLESFDFKSDYLGKMPDDLQKMDEILSLIKNNYDVLITSGGVSFGDADLTKKALAINGFNQAFHGIKIKPGHPILAGTMDKTLVISLPGNPMAAFLNAFLFAIPALKKISNFKNPNHKIYKAVNKSDIKLKPNRTNVILGNFLHGEFEVTNNNKFSSSMITPIAKSNCITLCDQEIINKDDIIPIILL